MKSLRFLKLQTLTALLELSSHFAHYYCRTSAKDFRRHYHHENVRLVRPKHLQSNVRFQADVHFLIIAATSRGQQKWRNRDANLEVDIVILQRSSLGQDDSR